MTSQLQGTTPGFKLWNQTPFHLNGLHWIWDPENLQRWRWRWKTQVKLFFSMMLSKGKITEERVNMFMTWRHSGFNVFSGPRIQPGEEDAIENLARYIIRASFSQERMTYLSEDSKVVYRSKDGKEEKIFDALERLVPTKSGCSHVPNKGESR